MNTRRHFLAGVSAIALSPSVFASHASRSVLTHAAPSASFNALTALVERRVNAATQQGINLYAKHMMEHGS